jgi:hypothetical protein
METLLKMDGRIRERNICGNYRVEIEQGSRINQWAAGVLAKRKGTACRALTSINLIPILLMKAVNVVGTHWCTPHPGADTSVCPYAKYDLI